MTAPRVFPIFIINMGIRIWLVAAYLLVFAFIQTLWLTPVALAQPSAGGGASAVPDFQPRVYLGIDTLAANKFKGLVSEGGKQRRVGLITNPSGVNCRGRTTLEVMREGGVNLVALFAPEYGVYGEVLDDVYQKGNTVDQRSNLPVHFLVNEARKPTPEMLKNIDVLVYDIQDIGCRAYTYIATLGLAMEAAGEAGIEFYVLDRPNPLGGNRIEGMPVNPRFTSNYGLWDIPYVYGLTCGELANMIYKQHWIKKLPKQLVVVPMKGWYRDMTWEDTGLIWVPPSPHIPTPDTAYYFAITRAIGEAGPVNQGIGYTIPFGVVGGPQWNPFHLADELNKLKMPGVYFRPIFYKPNYGPQQRVNLSGVQIHITDKQQINLCGTSAMMMEIIRTIPGSDLFVNPPGGELEFDRSVGGDELRTHFKRGGSAAELLQIWEPGLQQFRVMRKPYLLYQNSPQG
ncbi:DUF1343 domain-containing protein [Verrucomicrobia bacterium LW23]|nr:DUF1343 domain-containing protein [Verrucomicrobia bacterium LW23]